MTPDEYAAELEAGLAEMRAYVEATMTSRCTVRRKAGTFSVVDGLKVPNWTVVHTDLPVRIAGTSRGAATSRRQDIGGTEIEVAVRQAKFPADTADLADSDYIEITAGENTGLILRIIEATWQDGATARRVPVVGVVRPKEW